MHLVFNSPYCRKFLFKLPSTIVDIASNKYTATVFFGQQAVFAFIVICDRLYHGMMVVSLVGSCIALFGIKCLLAGRSDACKAADISTSLINIYTIVDMVSKKYTATVFFGHKWLTR